MWNKKAYIKLMISILCESIVRVAIFIAVLAAVNVFNLWGPLILMCLLWVVSEVVKPTPEELWITTNGR